jgi:TP53 regulating kinase-like protein
LTAEARALVRCSKVGVKVPGLRLVDHREGILGIEWIEGWSVREVLGGGQDDDMPEDEIEDDQVDEAEEDIIGNDNEVRDYLRQLGVEDGGFRDTLSSSCEVEAK